MTEYGIILFHNTTSAMQAEALLMRASLTVKLIPTPRELSSDCGISLRFDLTLKETVNKLLESAHVNIAGLHSLTGK